MKYNFTVTANSLIVTLDTESGKLEPKITEYLTPNLVLGTDRIFVKNNNSFVQDFVFEKIGLIGTETVINLIDAYKTLESLINSIFVKGKSAGAFIPNIKSTTSLETYGDSITLGVGSTNVGLYSYANKLAEEFGKPLTNRAVSGEGIWVNSKNHFINVNPGHNIFATIMAGFNDVRTGGADVKTRGKIKNGYRSIIANHFLKNYLQGNSSDTRITKSSNGNWFTFTGQSIGFKAPNGVATAIFNAQYEYEFTGNNVVIGTGTCKTTYQIWSSSIEILIDGISKGLFSLQNETDGISSGSHDGNRMPKAIVFNDLGEGFHTVKIINKTSDYMVIDYVGTMKDPGNCVPICILEIPKMASAGYAYNGYPGLDLANDNVINIVNQDIIDVCNEFISLGYPIIIAKTNDFYNVNTGISADTVHPNNIGYTQIYDAVNTAINL